MTGCIIITGMGRSGTSLVASLLNKAGISMGSRLVGPARINPRGFFEDADIYQFQEQLLHQRNQSIIVPDNFVFEPTDIEIEQARALIAQRANQEVWGWKDPRTSLFLDLWSQIVPDARYLFVFRHPLDVLMSFLRGEITYVAGIVEGLEAWLTYNRRIKAFYEQNREKCVLCHTYAITTRPAEFGALLNQRFGLGGAINDELLRSVYHAQELHQLSIGPATRAILTAIMPEVQQLYDELCALADVPFLDPVSDDQTVLAPVRVFVDALQRPFKPAAIRSAIMALMAAHEPDSFNNFFSGLRSSINEQSRARMWAEQQRINWEGTVQQNEAGLREVVAALSQVEQARDYYAQQASNWEGTVQQNEAGLREVIAALSQVEQARDYYAQQASNWESTANEYQSRIDQLTKQLLHTQAERDQLLEESLLQVIARRTRTALASRQHT